MDSPESRWVVVRNQGEGLDTMHATGSLAIGSPNGESTHFFGGVAGIAADDAGVIYVSDWINPEVTAFDVEGRFLARIGREGQGPGEFTRPMSLTFDSDGLLYVRDLYRISVFGPSSRGVRDSLVATWQGPRCCSPTNHQGAVDEEGRYYHPGARWVGGYSDRFYTIHEDGELLPDTLHVPSYPTLTRTVTANFPTGVGTGRIVRGVSAAPFSAVPSWQITSRGTVLSGDAEDYLLVETSQSGDTLRIIQRELPPAPVPSAEHRDSVAALELRIDSLPFPLADVTGVAEEVLEGRIPEILPAYLSIGVGSDDQIWVRRWPPPDQPDKSFFDVFDADGIYNGTVVVPYLLVSDPPPYFTHDAVYGVVRDPLTDVEVVVRARVR